MWEKAVLITLTVMVLFQWHLNDVQKERVVHKELTVKLQGV